VAKQRKKPHNMWFVGEEGGDVIATKNTEKGTSEWAKMNGDSMKDNVKNSKSLYKGKKGCIRN